MNYKSFRDKMRTYRLIWFLYATLFLIIAFIALISHEDRLGDTGTTLGILLFCGYAVFLTWLRPEKPEGELSDVSDVISSARSMGEKRADEKREIIKVPADLTIEQWRQLGFDLSHKLGVLFPDSLGTKIFIASEAVFRLIRGNQEIQIAVAKYKPPKTSGIQRSVAITISRVVPHQKLIFGLFIAMVVIVVLAGLLFDFDSDVAEFVIVVVGMVMLSVFLKRGSADQRRNAESFPSTELSELLCELKIFVQAELDKFSFGQSL